MRNVLVTGATGTLGNALVPRLLSAGVERVVAFSRDELKQSEMRTRLTSPRLRFFLGDVRDRDRLALAFRGVDTIIHAAALKQVPALEYSPSEAVMTNVMGALNVVGAALAENVRRVLFVSTDKASQPSTLYGATKLTAERLFTAANAYSGQDGPIFACVRYGNVAGSRGSVIPVWRAMMQRGEVPSVTHPDMTRFWMTIDEAVDLILRSVQRMRGGEVFIPRLPAFRVTDLWRAMTGRSDDPPLTGIRPAEKLHESLIGESEAADAVDLGDDYALTRAVADEARPRTTGLPVPEGFVYASNTVPLLGADELMARVNVMRRAA